MLSTPYCIANVRNAATLGARSGLTGFMRQAISE